MSLVCVYSTCLFWCDRFGVGDSTGVVVVAETLLAIGALGIYTVVLPKFIPAFTVVGVNVAAVGNDDDDGDGDGGGIVVVVVVDNGDD